MSEDRSDAAIVARMIDRIRLLIALADDIPVETKLNTQPLLKMFQASVEAAAVDASHEGVASGYYARLCADLDEYPDLNALLSALRVFLTYL